MRDDGRDAGPEPVRTTVATSAPSAARASGAGSGAAVRTSTFAGAGRAPLAARLAAGAFAAGALRGRLRGGALAAGALAAGALAAGVASISCWTRAVISDFSVAADASTPPSLSAFFISPTFQLDGSVMASAFSAPTSMPCFAPASMARTTAEWPFSSATVRGLHCEASRAVVSAPPSTRTCATLAWPFCAAAWSGVDSPLLRIETGWPCATSHLATAACPLAAAQWSAEWPMKPSGHPLPRYSNRLGSALSSGSIARRSPRFAASSHSLPPGGGTYSGSPLPSRSRSSAACIFSFAAALSGSSERHCRYACTASESRPSTSSAAPRRLWPLAHLGARFTHASASLSAFSPKPIAHQHADRFE